MSDFFFFGTQNFKFQKRKIKRDSMMRTVFKALAAAWVVVHGVMGAQCLTKEVRGVAHSCMTHNGLERCWYKVVPISVNETNVASAPVLVVMHGYSGCADELEYMGWNSIARRDGMVLLLPQGTEELAGQSDPKPSWNAGSCCQGAMYAGIDDVGFIREVIQDAIDTVPAADKSRIVLAGHSNGCAMAQRFALEANDLATVVACHSFYSLTNDLTAYDTPIPVAEVHGVDDQVVRYSDNDYGWPDAEENLKTWATRNDCFPDGEKISVNQIADGFGFTRHSYTCRDGNEVVLFAIPNEGHTPFSYSSSSPDTTELLHQWAMQYRRVGSKIVSAFPLSTSPTASPTTTGPSVSPSTATAAPSLVDPNDGGEQPSSNAPAMMHSSLLILIAACICVF